MSYQRSVDEKRRLRKLYYTTKHAFGSGAYYCDRKGRIVRYYASRANGAGQFLRKVSNKKVRQRMEALRGSQYRRVYDYWWNLF